jgi:gluconate 2-dehydrogenase
LKPKLLVSRALPDTVMAALAGRFEVTLRPTTAPMSEAEAIAALAEYDAVLPTLGDRFTAAAFAAVPAPRARILANFGMGYNHLAVEAARAAGVAVTNTPGAVTEATADIAILLMLMATRRASEGEAWVREGTWPGWEPMQLLGLQIGGKTLGVVGMGNIGKAVARRAHHGFGMRVVFFNRSRVAEPGVPAEQMDSLHGVMAAADVVVIAVPGGAATRHMIDAAAIGAMKPTGYLVNVARGDVVDETALIEALERKAIAGAGLDVYEFEPKVPERLRALKNVSLLPHLGTATLEARTAMGMVCAANLFAHLDGRPLPNPV